MKCKKYLLATRDTNYAGDTLYVEEGYIDFKLFSSRKKAEEGLKKQLEELIWEAGRLNPSRFNFAEWGGQDSVTLVEYIRSVWEKDSNFDEFEIDYLHDLYLPDTATFEEFLMAYEISGLTLFEIIELEEDGN